MIPHGKRSKLSCSLVTLHYKEGLTHLLVTGAWVLLLKVCDAHKHVAHRQRVLITEVVYMTPYSGCDSPTELLRFTKTFVIQAVCLSSKMCDANKRAVFNAASTGTICYITQNKHKYV